MRHAPGVSVLGSIACRSDYGRVFRPTLAAQYAAGRGSAHHCRSGQPGRDRQTAKNSGAIKARSTAPSEIAASAAGRPARTAGTGCGPCTGATAAACGKTEAKTEAEAKAEAKAKTQGKAKTQSHTKAASPALTGGAKAEAETQEAR